MISYQIYKIMHIVGLMCVFSGLAALLGVYGTAPLERHPSIRKSLAILHGLGMVFLLVGGFGMLARLGIVHGGLPVWVYLKLAIWLALGGSMTLARKKANVGMPLLLLWIFLGGLAAAIALYKPFT